jgi:hypothetical protein
MNFQLKIADYAEQQLPFTSQEHDSTDPVPLLSDDEVAETTTKFRTIMSALGVES